MPRTTTRRSFLASALVVPALGQAQLPAARPGGALLIGGTGSGLGPLQRVADEAGARALRFVPSLGTGGGLKAVAAGAIDIAVAARRLSDEERAKGLVEREVFRTPIVWAAHDGVPVRQATLDDLASLYAARTLSWPSGVPVRLVLRPDSDTDTRFLKSLGPAMAEAVSAAQARPGVHVAATDTDTTEALERIAGSLGLTTLGLVRAERRRLHVLALAGVTPALETLASGRYPYAKTLYLVTRGTPTGPLVEAVHALTSRAAAQALAAISCQAGPAA